MDQIKIYPAHEFILERDLDDIVKDIKERKNKNLEKTVFRRYRINKSR